MSRRRRRTLEKQRRHAPSERLTPTGRRLATGAGVTVGATLLMSGVADAACTCTVNSLADPTDGANTTLRDAITSANANPGSTITFASGLTGTITLSTGLPQITVPVTIAGAGAGQLAVSGAHDFRPFDINAGAGDDVTISGLTITAGYSVGSGAGVFSHGGGADLTISNDVISDNHTSAGNQGGGIQVQNGTLMVTDSTIMGNSSGNRGGGIDTAQSNAGPATIRNSTISGNQGGGTGGGGGIYFNYGAPATVENSTVYGGGLYHYGGHPGQGLIVTGSTITHNTAAQGGGIASYGGVPNPEQPIIRNTVVSGNNAPVGPDLSTRNVSSMTATFSLIGSVNPHTTINQPAPGSDIFGVDPQLGPLADNGGPTMTQKPALTSPVVDKGAAFGLTADQRGLPRPVDFPTIPNSGAAGGDGSDIGAVELQPADLPNGFTARVKGKKLLVNVSFQGTVGVTDAAAPLSAGEAKRKRGLKSSSASGGPPTITVPLRLTKQAEQKLREKGKVTVKARITFTPTGGVAKTQTQKLKIKGKKKK